MVVQAVSKTVGCGSDFHPGHMKKDVTIDRICEVFDYESNTSNFKVSFKDLTTKYGAEYIVFCQAMWEANDDVMTEEEFISMNGNMPKAFFEKVIKNKIINR